MDRPRKSIDPRKIYRNYDNNFLTFTILFSCHLISLLITYFNLSNKRGSWNKPGGGAKVAKSINVEVGILQLELSPFVFK